MKASRRRALSLNGACCSRRNVAEARKGRQMAEHPCDASRWLRRRLLDMAPPIGPPVPRAVLRAEIQIHPHGPAGAREADARRGDEDNGWCRGAVRCSALHYTFANADRQHQQRQQCHQQRGALAQKACDGNHDQPSDVLRGAQYCPGIACHCRVG